MSEKTFETLIPDVYKLLDGADLSEAVKDFGDKLSRTVADRIREHGNVRKPTLRMSNLGRPLRQLWYELKGYKGEVLLPEAKFKFMYGDLLETLFIFLAQEAGHTVEGLQADVELDGVPGHLDCIIDGVLSDVKSCSTYSWQKFKTGDIVVNDPFGYIGQLSGYKQATGIERAAFIAIDKTLGKICSFELPSHIASGYNVSDRIKQVREATSKDTPPERCYSDAPDGKSGNRKLSTPCSYCSFKHHCWEDLKVYYYSNGPRYLTQVKKEPRVSNEESY